MSESTAYKQINPIFVGGCPRSGTTMMGVQISGHPRCFTTPESHFFYQLLQHRDRHGEILWGDFVAIVERHTFYATWEIDPDWASYAAAGSAIDLADGVRWLVWQYKLKHYSGKQDVTHWVDHTPENVLHSHSLLNLFPQSRFLHLKRDGRACFASVKDLNWGPNSPTMAANWWLKYVGMGDATLAAFPGRCSEIYYEEFVQNYPRSLEILLSTVSLPVAAEAKASDNNPLPGDLLDYQHSLVTKRPDPARLHSWRDELKFVEVVRFDAVATNMLKLNGYEPMAPYEPETPIASIGCYLWELFILPVRLMSFGFVWRKYIARTYFRWIRRSQSGNQFKQRARDARSDSGD